MKTIRVVAAVIVREKNNQKQIFATQRGYGELLSILASTKNLLERLMRNCRTRMSMSSFQPYMKRFLTSM